MASSTFAERKLSAFGEILHYLRVINRKLDIMTENEQKISDALDDLATSVSTVITDLTELEGELSAGTFDIDEDTETALLGKIATIKGNLTTAHASVPPAPAPASDPTTTPADPPTGAVTPAQAAGAPTGGTPAGAQ